MVKSFIWWQSLMFPVGKKTSRPCTEIELTVTSLHTSLTTCASTSYFVICFWRQIPVLLAVGALPCFVITVPGGSHPRGPDDKPLPSEERGWLGRPHSRELDFYSFLVSCVQMVLVSKQSPFLSWSLRVKLTLLPASPGHTSSRNGWISSLPLTL